MKFSTQDMATETCLPVYISHESTVNFFMSVKYIYNLCSTLVIAAQKMPINLTLAVTLQWGAVHLHLEKKITANHRQCQFKHK